MGKSITDLSAVTTVGLGLAKHNFQVHGVDASGRVVVTKAMRRNKVLEFLLRCPPVLWGLRSADRRITGRGS
jgi:transposase